MADKVDQGWIVPLACCFINGALFGVFRSYGILYSVLMDTLHVNRSAAAWPFSLCMTVVHLTGPISGLLNQRYSCRTIVFVGCLLAAIGTLLCYTAHSIFELTIYVGVIQGFGIGLTYVQMTSIINMCYSSKCRARANGISLSGGTLGAFFLSYLIGWSLKHFPLRKVFVILSIVTSTTLPVCWLLKPTQAKDKMDAYKANQGSNYLSAIFGQFKGIEGKKSNKTSKDSKVCQEDAESTSEDKCGTGSCKNMRSTIIGILLNPMFILITLTHIAYFWSCITFQMIIVDYAADKKILANKAAQLIGGYSLGDLIGRLGSGWLMDNNVIPDHYLAMLSSVGVGLLLNMTTLTENYVAFLIISFSLGSLSGLINVLLNNLYCRYISIKRASLAFGLTAFVSGLLALGRPAALGYFRDSESGSYDGLFVVLGCVSCLIGSLWLFKSLLYEKQPETPITIVPL
ncbi:Monocarboxylate transporter 13 [Halotydeus destructor]|nr:Monocarboxylate transporter 13 [Halotydeus destructor]